MDSRLCACGCGEQIRPSVYGSRKPDGTFRTRDSGAKFLRGHHIRVNRPSWWKGDQAGYRSLHTYVSKHFPKTGTCEVCGVNRYTEYALIKDRSYSRNREDYRELCRPCHNSYDGMAGGRGV